VIDRRSLPPFQDFLKDLRFSLRVLRKSRAFTIIAVIALALGIGFSTTLSSIFYNGVLHPFPYRDANRLTVISVVDTQNEAHGDFSMGERLDLVPVPTSRQWPAQKWLDRMPVARIYTYRL
jgi:hypothetical protein